MTLYIRPDPRTFDSPSMGSVEWKILTPSRRIASGLRADLAKALNDSHECKSCKEVEEAEEDDILEDEE